MSYPANKQAQRIKLAKLHKRYGNFHAVKGLDLEVLPGEFLVLLGPSGCGKSTALRMIAGLEEISEGQVFIGENEVTNVLPKYRDIAMVFQSYALYPHKTVAENIGFPLKIAGQPKDEMAVAVTAAAAQVRLDTLLERYPRELSGGQQQRVALARAIIRRPSAFLMDEPLSNLDAKLRGAMRAELKRMQRDLGVTTVYVTHDQIEAMTLAHRVAIMRDGVLQQLGTPNEVYRNPSNIFVAGFMGSPPMNFVEGVSDGKAVVFEGGRITHGSGISSGQRINIGFRPEDTTITSPDAGCLTAEVFVAEMTGNETLVTLTCPDGSHSIAKAAADASISDGTRVGIEFSPASTYFFDTESGKRVLSDPD